MGGFLGLNIVYTYAASGEVTQLPIDVAWACTNLWSGLGILLGPFFSGLLCYLSCHRALYLRSFKCLHDARNNTSVLII